MPLSAETHSTPASWPSSRGAGATWTARSPRTRSTPTRPPRPVPCARRWSKRVSNYILRLCCRKMIVETKAHLDDFKLLPVCHLLNYLLWILKLVINIIIFKVTHTLQLYYPYCLLVSHWTLLYFAPDGHQLMSCHQSWININNLFSSSISQSTTRSSCPDRASGRTSTRPQIPASVPPPLPSSRPSSARPVPLTVATEPPRKPFPRCCSWALLPWSQRPWGRKVVETWLKGCLVNCAFT